MVDHGRDVTVAIELALVEALVRTARRAADRPKGRLKKGSQVLGGHSPGSSTKELLQEPWLAIACDRRQLDTEPFQKRRHLRTAWVRQLREQVESSIRVRTPRHNEIFI
jgi:hypothetical protein